MELTRRRFLTAAGGATVATVLVGCGDDDDAASTTTTAAATTTADATTTTATAATTTTAAATTTTAAATTTTAAATTTTAAAPLPVMDATTRTMLDQLFDAQLTATGVPGMAGVVRIGDGVWTRSAGVADLTSGEAYRPGDFVRIASITKTFTATAALQLVDTGRISLDDLLEQYVPGVINGTVCTVRDLLAMQSGIPDFTANQAFGERFAADPLMPWTDADTLAVIAEAPGPDFAPGEKCAYCDSNYALLGMITKLVTGEPVGTTITSTVIEPLGLTSTFYPTEGTIPSPHPTGYVPDPAHETAPFDNVAYPPRVVNEVNPAVAGAAGAMIGTLDDLQAWGTELVRGTLLRPETQALRLQFRRFDGVPVNIGYGLGVLNVNEFVGHNGAIFGFSSIVLTRPETQTQLAFVANEATNSTSSMTDVALAVIGALYPDQLT